MQLITKSSWYGAVPCVDYNYLQEAQLSQRDCAMLGVIEYFAKSLKVIQNGILEKGVGLNPY